MSINESIIHPETSVLPSSNLFSHTTQDKKTTLEKRIDWIDIAKGIGILLVVLGHGGFPEKVQWWIWSFHMPLFFFISGCLFSIDKYPSIAILFKKRNKNLLRPYLFFSLLVLVGFLVLEPQAIIERVKNTILYGWGGFALWFIPVLYFTELLFYYPKKYLNTGQLFVFLFISCSIGYIFSISNIFIGYQTEVVFTSIFFYGVGNLLSTRINSFLADSKKLYLLGFSSFVLAINVCFCFLNSTRFDLCTNNFGNIIYAYLAAYAGIAFIISISHLIPKLPLFHKIKVKQNLAFLGANTFVLLALHQIVMLLLIKFFEHNFLINGVISSILRHSILWITLLTLIFIINKYFPFILGSKRK